MQREVLRSLFYQEEEEHDGDGDEDGDEEMSAEEWSVQVGEALIQDGSNGDGLGKLARHETTLMNALTKTLQMLFLLQGSRGHNEGDAVVIEATALRGGRGEGSIAA
jgi:hypothetical protein